MYEEIMEIELRPKDKNYCAICYISEAYGECRLSRYGDKCPFLTVPDCDNWCTLFNKEIPYGKHVRSYPSGVGHMHISEITRLDECLVREENK